MKHIVEDILPADLQQYLQAPETLSINENEQLEFILQSSFCEDKQEAVYLAVIKEGGGTPLAFGKISPDAMVMGLGSPKSYNAVSAADKVYLLRWQPVMVKSIHKSIGSIETQEVGIYYDKEIRKSTVIGAGAVGFATSQQNTRFSHHFFTKSQSQMKTTISWFSKLTSKNPAQITLQDFLEISRNSTQMLFTPSAMPPAKRLRVRTKIGCPQLPSAQYARAGIKPQMPRNSRD